MKRIYALCILILIALSTGRSQNDLNAFITGIVTDAISERPIELATVYIKGSSTAVESSVNGRYQIRTPANEAFTLVVTRIGYKQIEVPIDPMPPRSSRQIDVALAPTDSDLEVIVRASKLEESGMVREEMTQLRLLPSTTGNLESVLTHIALGASSGAGGELTSQYNIRGGNYDENLVYVNDFEIYRPQLIRAGQQEGLTFPNIDLIRYLSFSSGGFESRYGDKMSSVLDVKYKRPDSLRASVGMSFLGGSAHVEGSLNPHKDEYRRLRYLVGARYKTTRYLLGTLDVKGEYTPDFADVQTYITYDISKDLQLGFLGNYNKSLYRFQPSERSTAFGLINLALELFSVFDGQEIDDFTTSMGGLSLTYLPERQRNPFFLKFLTSGFQSQEDETFDIIGRYSLRQIDSDKGSDNFGEVLAELGSGVQQQFVRNFLTLNVYNAELKGGLELQKEHPSQKVTSSHFLQWSVKMQNEQISDQINEWERLDSAGYSLNYDPGQVLLFSVLKTRNELNSMRYNAYFQDTYTFRRDEAREFKITAGVRAAYWDLNAEWLVSPRMQLLYKPLAGRRDVSYRLAGGLYFQPPFYREMRMLNGMVNTGLRSQKSAHIVGGLTYDFYLGKRNPKKFRLITEAYYKELWDLVSYEIENVRIRYSGINDATGYAAGVDVRLNGEFVPGAESWINLSVMTAQERLNGVVHECPVTNGDLQYERADYVPRPTDRRVNLSVFFQDYLPSNENFKMNLNFTVGTGLPFGIPNNNIVCRNPFRFNPYHRVDIGFAYQLWDEARRYEKPNNFLGFTRNTWVSLEVFNLMQVQNQAGNTWIKTIFSQQYAIPNYLTSRRINLRLRMDF